MSSGSAPNFLLRRTKPQRAAGKTAELRYGFETRCNERMPCTPGNIHAAWCGRRDLDPANLSAMATRKIQMFNEAEIGLFTKAGLNPVFYADKVIGTRMPT